ncbi:MAG TPA: class I SAM-dependent methyltransferase [Polyangiaceae bacterium]|jgi:ubiquinone/menaquinone biosynthesis C-methylase UbiE|nr:class I SAM-dependent methyltransferase [Polyangiaceae bacterium]
MAERAHPNDPGFKDSWFGLKKNKYKQKLYERYEFCNAHIKDRVILDIPCGSGWGTSLLKRYQRCTGVDISEEAIAFAKREYERPGTLEFMVGSMEKLPAGDASLDVIVCLEGFEHVDRAIGSAFLDESQRALKRGGLLLMTCPVLNEYGEDTGNPYHLCEYPEEELIDKLNRGFRIQSLDRVQGPEGPEYRVVVQNIAGQRYLKR